jgi:hypothetical protein
MDNLNPPTPAAGGDPESQRQRLLESQRKAHRDEPDSVKEEALTDKVVHIQPDGTGPSSTGTMDPRADRANGSGNPTTRDDASHS